MPKKIHALTVKYTGFSNVLQSKATMGVAFDPKTTPPTKTLEFNAIWDTGATASVITQNVANKCGLKPTGMVQVHTASGSNTSNTYLVSLALPNGVGFPAVKVTEATLPRGTDLLIGMDIIGAGDFAVSNFKGKTVFTYRFPSVAMTDFVQEGNQMSKPGRNDPCSCGSGKKFKKCCGKN